MFKSRNSFECDWTPSVWKCEDSEDSDPGETDTLSSYNSYMKDLSNKTKVSAFEPLPFFSLLVLGKRLPKKRSPTTLTVHHKVVDWSVI